MDVEHVGRGNTIGDAFVYLPKEKILATGDLLVHPVLYAFDGYPSEWVKTLQSMAQLDVEAIVRGHGEVLYGKVFLYELIDLMQSIIAQVGEVVARDPNVTLDNLKKTIDIKSFRGKMAGPDGGEMFDYSIGSSFVELAYNEAKQR